MERRGDSSGCIVLLESQKETDNRMIDPADVCRRDFLDKLGIYEYINIIL